MDSTSLSKFYEVAVASIWLIVVPVIMLKGVLSFFSCVKG